MQLPTAQPGCGGGGGSPRTPDRPVHIKPQYTLRQKAQAAHFKIIHDLTVFKTDFFHLNGPGSKNNMHPPANMHDLTPDLLHRIMETKSLMMLRAVCKNMKTRIENLPETEIVLSPEGTAVATSHFFSHFKGNLTVRSECVTGTSICWFESLLGAVQRGVKVEKVSTLCINSKTACALSESLQRVVSNGISSRIIHISVSIEGSSSGFRKSLSAISQLSSVADEVEISVDLTFRNPMETLWGINQQIMSLGGCFTIKDMCIRCVRCLGNTPLLIARASNKASKNPHTWPPRAPVHATRPRRA